MSGQRNPLRAADVLAHALSDHNRAMRAANERLPDIQGDGRKRTPAEWAAWVARIHQLAEARDARIAARRAAADAYRNGKEGGEA